MLMLKESSKQAISLKRRIKKADEKEMDDVWVWNPPLPLSLESRWARENEEREDNRNYGRREKLWVD